MLLSLPGFRLWLWGDCIPPTHAVCRHGVLVPATADSHACTWQLLVEVKEV